MASSGSVTTTQGNELFFGTAWSTMMGDTWTAGPGYTLRQQETDNDTYERHATEDKVVSSATTTSASFTTSSSDNWAAVIATFNPLMTQGGGAATTTVRYVHTDHLGGTTSSPTRVATSPRPSRIIPLDKCTSTTSKAPTPGRSASSRDMSSMTRPGSLEADRKLS